MGINIGTTGVDEIYVGEGTLVNDYSAMRGPCPEGFHIPMNTEWQAVYNIWTALGGGASDGTNFGTALKLPFAGQRNWFSSNVGNLNTDGEYWSCSRLDADTAYAIRVKSDTINAQEDFTRSDGFPVRGFKDSPVVPDNTWTTLKSGTGSAGIFWSSSLGLISMSGDGTTWITIADKNLGATTVWNSGDTLSETNCGGYFQRGNNYMFPFTGTVTTSSTQVDASNYGPGNYYNSSTFIKYGGRWDSTDNANLRGGETGIQQQEQAGNVIEVYVGTTKVRPTETVLFDFGDWTNSQWTTTGTQGTITRTSSYISFFNGSGFSQNKLSEYEIDYTKNFLFECRANIPNTSASYHRVSLGIVSFGTSWESNRRNKIWGVVNNTDYGGDTNNGPRDFFFRWENGTFTIGWDGVTKGTGTYTLTGQESPYLREQVYKNTLTIYTAKLTYF